MFCNEHYTIRCSTHTPIQMRFILIELIIKLGKNTFIRIFNIIFE